MIINYYIKLLRLLHINLNKIIDINFYPTDKTKTSNMRHRPIGIGVLSLQIHLPKWILLSIQMRHLLNTICNFETMYHGALEMSMELAHQEGSYETFEGSPASKYFTIRYVNVEPQNI